MSKATSTIVFAALLSAMLMTAPVSGYCMYEQGMSSEKACKCTQTYTDPSDYRLYDCLSNAAIDCFEVCLNNVADESLEECGELCNRWSYMPTSIEQENDCFCSAETRRMIDTGGNPAIPANNVLVRTINNPDNVELLRYGLHCRLLALVCAHAQQLCTQCYSVCEDAAIAHGNRGAFYAHGTELRLKYEELSAFYARCANSCGTGGFFGLNVLQSVRIVDTKA